MLQNNVYAMKKKDKGNTDSKKRSLLDKFHNRGQTSTQETPVTVQLLSGVENIPNLYLASLATAIQKTPKEFLDTEIKFPATGTVRDYIAYQEHKDEYKRSTPEEHNENINNYLTRIFFEDDNNIIITLATFDQEDMYFKKIMHEIEKITEEKVEKQNRKQIFWELVPTLLLSLNVGIVAGLGAFLLKKNENQLFGYSTMAIGLSGLTIMLPRWYKHSTVLLDSSKKLKEYHTTLSLINKKRNENFKSTITDSYEVRYITNE